MADRWQYVKCEENDKHVCVWERQYLYLSSLYVQQPVIKMRIILLMEVYWGSAEDFMAQHILFTEFA